MVADSWLLRRYGANKGQKRILPLHTDFGLVRRAQQADAERIVEMVGKLAAHHGDTATLTVDDLIRDISGEDPWLYTLVAAADGELVGLVEASKIKASALLCRYMTVGTHPDNRKAQALYEAWGFERKDTHPPRFSIRLEA